MKTYSQKKELLEIKTRVKKNQSSVQNYWNIKLRYTLREKDNKSI